MTVTAWLLIAVPPLVGALIGFITNVIAIKMLFRPLREIRVVGIRLPFTPGILPRQRHKLADSIGAMVERELFTPELLRERLAAADVRQKLKDSVSNFTEKFISRRLDSFFAEDAGAEGSGRSGLVQSLGETFVQSPAFAALADIIKKRAGAELEEQFPALRSALLLFLRRADIHRELEIQGNVFLSGVFLKLNVFQRLFISAAQYDRTLNGQMPKIIDSLIEHIDTALARDTVRARALELLDTILERQLAANKPFGEIASFVKTSLCASHGEQDLQTFFSINSAQKKEFDEMLCAGILRVADAEIENLLRTINIRTLVSHRIDTLDMIRVERIILDVMANQLKWIDLFGALLGFLIGVFQVLISRFLR